MVKLKYTVEFPDAETTEEALAMMDTFREAVLPALEYGIVIYRWADGGDKQEAILL